MVDRKPANPGGWSYRTQAVWAALALVVLGIGVFGALTHRELNRSLAAKVMSELEGITHRAALELQSPMSRWSGGEIEAVAQRAMSNRIVTSVSVTDVRGETVALHLREDAALAETSRALAVSAPHGGLVRAREVRRGNRRLGWGCRVTVWSQDEPARQLGHVTITCVEDSVDRVTAALPRAALVAGAASMVLAGPLAIWAASGLIRPVRRVAQAAEALERRERPEMLEVRGPREVRRLAASFNTMSASLAEAMDRLERSKADLEATVAERTRQLAAINTVLEKQAQAKNEFLRSVSHDLGAPLRNIAGMAALVLEQHADSLPPDAVHRLERITANVEIEHAMLSELLDLSRASERAERITRVSVLDAARELAASLGDDLRRRRIELVVDPSLPVLRVDRTDLWMLLQNLTDNALKYMGDATERRVEIRSVRGASGGPGFCVVDTGPGIPEPEHDRVFRVFQRASSRGSEPGRGVGLAVVQSIVDRWGGEIRLISAAGEGTTFEILLPVEREAAEAAAVTETGGKS